jgi:pimeloyl-ACP methyl ester carboxylesterase
MKHARALALFVALLATSVTGARAQSDAAGRYANVNGIRMYYELHGSGPPLVLIHGGGSTIQSSFGAIIPMLARKHRIIAVELQAHGRTSDRSAPESFEQDADDVAELLRQLGIPKADILGFSNGGSTALQIAVRHPDRVNTLIPIAAIYRRDGMQSGFWTSMKKATFADMPQVYKDAFLSVTPDRAKLVNMFNRDRQRMLAFRGWSPDAMRRISAPALVVVGDRDVVRAEHAVEMVRLLPHGRLVILPGVHGEMLGELMTRRAGSRAPEMFTAILEEFLAAPGA